MAGGTKLHKVFDAFKGIDLRSSDILRTKDSATDVLNMQYRQTGALTKRKGYQYITENDGGYGITTFNNVNTSTGVVTQEVLTIDDTLSIMNDQTFTATYTGSGTTVTYENVLDATTSKFFFTIVVDTVEAMSLDLGTGIEGSPVTVTTLVSTINALSDFTSGTITGSAGAHPAALIPTKSKQTISASGTLIAFNNATAVSLPGSYATPFTEFYDKRTTSGFENATFAQVDDILFIATGHNDLHKYDGRRLYKAGLPKAATPTLNSITTPGSGTFTAVKDMRYKVEIQYTDDKSNIVQSEISDHLIVTTLALTTNNVVLDFTNLTTGTGAATTDGYDTDGTMVYNIFRTDDSSDATATSLYFLIGTVNQGTSQFTDTGLIEGAQFVPPIKQRGEPPKTKYVDVWRNQLILSGDIANVNTIYYSDIDSAEYFPDADNAINVSSKVTGIKAMNNNLFIFQDRTIDGVTGDFATDQFQVDSLSREGIGCEAHATIQEVNGALFFLSNRGVRAVNAEGIDDVGFPIQPKFASGNVFTNKQAVAYHWEKEEKYLLFMPNTPVDPSYAADADSEIFVFDTIRNAWLEWGSYNFMGGVTEKGDDTYIQGRTSTRLNISKITENSDKFDYADHTASIEFTYSTHWEALGEPSVNKKFIRIKIHSYDTTVDDFEVQSFQLGVKTENDYIVDTLTNATLDFSAGSDGWGAGAWGQFRWGESRQVQIRQRLASKKAKSMRVIFSNDTVHENVLISGYELEITAPYRLRIK